MLIIFKNLIFSYVFEANKKHLQSVNESSKRRSVSAPIAQLVEQLICNQ